MRGSKISGEACENMAARLTKANRRQVKKTSSCIAVYIYTQNYHLCKTQFFNISTKRDIKQLNYVTHVKRNLILLLRIFFPPSIKLRPFLHYLHISQPFAPAPPLKHLFSLFLFFIFLCKRAWFSNTKHEQ